jgi:hypothetical protein
MRPCATSASLKPPVSSRTCTPPAAAPPGSVGPLAQVALPGAGSEGPEEGVTGPVQQEHPPRNRLGQLQYLQRVLALVTRYDTACCDCCAANLASLR